MNIPKPKFIYPAVAIIFLIPAAFVIQKYFQAEEAPAEFVSRQTETSGAEEKTEEAAGEGAPSGAPMTEEIEKNNGLAPEKTESSLNFYPVHQDITTTIFWVGEEASSENKNISNFPSAWDEDWLKHFGGVDNPKKRNGYFPAGFIPEENPFYFALPYNDFDSKGERKALVFELASWAKGQKCSERESVCKNRWIKITKSGSSAYAQWEDVGPFKENDAAYVFGSSAPKSKTNKNAGLDVSPAVRDYLGLSDIDKVNWQFVNEADVPAGPWKEVITTSQIYWK